MARANQHRSLTNIGQALLAVAVSLFCLGLGLAQAQTFTVLHSFSGGADGGNPHAPVTVDEAGNVYGTTYSGGSGQAGTVFKLVHRASGWLLNPLYSFQGRSDGANPVAAVAIGPEGVLYGTTPAGGRGYCAHGYPFDGCGVVFSLRPQGTVCRAALCPWTESVLYAFSGSDDGDSPSNGAVVFDPAGSLYGTTIWGGNDNWGVVYRLTYSNGSWAESVLHSLVWQDGVSPVGGVVFDASGNLYGAGEEGGGANLGGTIFQLSPAGYGWTLNVLYSFPFLSPPSGGLELDQSGNLYGKTDNGGTHQLGGVYQLQPSSYGWTFNMIYNFTRGNDGGWWQGGGPVFDRDGNLYDTTYNDGAYGLGTVFKLTPGSDGWTYTSLHDFTGGSDGANPHAGLAIDSQGNLYGTTEYGGGNNQGVVFEITP